MPTQRISKPFKDVSATFQINPLNSDLIGLKNANAISRSIRNLILTIIVIAEVVIVAHRQ